jgi:hypothetical protein
MHEEIPLLIDGNDVRSMMRVRDRDRKGIGRVGRQFARTRQEHADHRLDLVLVGVTVAGDRLFDARGGIFGDGKPGLPESEYGSPSGLTQFQGRRRVLVNESFLNRRVGWLVLRDHGRNSVRQQAETLRHGEQRIRGNTSRRDETETITVLRHYSPAGVPETGIDTDDA